MKVLFFLIICSQIIFVSAQIPIKTSIELTVGHYYFNNSFSASVLKLNHMVEVYSPYSVALSFSNFGFKYGGREGVENLGTSISYVLPFEIKLDSSQMKFSGFSFRQNIGLDVLKKVNWVALNLSVGYSAGRTKLYGNKSLNQKNQFFKPEIGIQPKFLIKRFCVSFSAFYGVDISSNRWKKAFLNKVPQLRMEDFKQGGLNLSVGLGMNVGSKVVGTGGIK